MQTGLLTANPVRVLDVKRLKSPVLNQALDLVRPALPDNGAPARKRALGPSLLRPLLPSISITDVLYPGPRFRMRLIGTAVVDHAGEDHTGRYLEDLPNSDGLIAHSKYCVALAAPFAAESRMVWTRNDFRRFQVLVIPASDKGERVDYLYAFYDFDLAAAD